MKAKRLNIYNLNNKSDDTYEFTAHLRSIYADNSLINPDFTIDSTIYYNSIFCTCFYFIEKYIDKIILYFADIIKDESSYEIKAKEAAIFYKDDIVISKDLKRNILMYSAAPVNIGVHDEGIKQYFIDLYGTDLFMEDFCKLFVLNDGNHVFNIIKTHIYSTEVPYNDDILTLPKLHDSGRRAVFASFSWNNNNLVSFIQMVDDIPVFRIYCMDSGDREVGRIYVFEDKIRAFLKLPYGFRESKYSQKCFVNIFHFYIAGYDDLNERLKYLTKYFNIDKNKLLAGMIYSKSIENLIKSGGEELYYNILNIQENYDIKEAISSIFGEEISPIFNTAESFSKLTGLPQYMIDYFKEYPKAMLSVKDFIMLLGKDYYIHIDRNTFINLTATFNIFYENSFFNITQYIECLNIIIRNHGVSKLFEASNYIFELYRYGSTYNEDIFQSGKYYCFNYLSVYLEYLRQLQVLALRDIDVSDYKWFPAYNDIVERYNALMIYTNENIGKLIDDKYNVLFASQKPHWKPYLYEDDNFIIKSPDKPLEVLNEGKALHHCVATYLNSIGEGNTIILFIRKKSEPNKPYFTLAIEDDEIKGCYGFANKTPDDDLIEFIREYAKSKALKYN